MQKFLFFLILLFFSYMLSGQNLPSFKIGSDYSKLSFADFSKKIEKEHSLKIFFNEKWVEKITIPEIEAPLSFSDVLNKALSAAGLHYIEYQQNVVVMPGADVLKVNQISNNLIAIGNPLEQGKFKKAVVFGTVLDGKNNSPIHGAQIICDQSSKSTTTDQNGKFSIELSTGKNQLKFRFMGLNEEVRDIILYGNGEIEVELFEKSISIDQINIMADKPEDNYRSTSMGMVKMNMKSIKKLSVLMGETDIIKSMTMLPGVQSVGENASGFNVRGGNIDQNLILVHDAPIYNTSHLFGLFTMLDPSVISDVTLYKSGIPARYGGRVSSVMNIELRKLEPQKTTVNGSIGIVNSRLSVEAPIIKNKLNVNVGARSTYSDWMLKLLKNYDLQQSSVSFNDFNMKVDYSPNMKNKVSLFAYGSNDYFYYYNNAEYGYGNIIGAAKWTSFYDNKNSGSLSVNFSRYNANVSDFSSRNNEFSLITNIQQEQVSYHFSTGFLVRHKLNAGASIVSYYIEPGYSSPYSELSVAQIVDIDNEQAIEPSVYAEDEFEITTKLSLIGGLRYSGFALLGPLTKNIYPENMPKNAETVSGAITYQNGEIAKLQHALEPRLALRWELSNNSSVKVGYNRTTQNIRQISNSASITPADYWKASDSFISPLISDQYALGFFKNIGNNNYETSLEIYYKNIENEIDYKNGAKLILNQNLEQSLISGVGRSYGAELLVKKNSGDLTGWIAYTYSRSFKKIDGVFGEERINDGQWYMSNYDKPHDLTLVMNYKISRRFSFGANFTYSTGRPVTLPENKYFIGGHEVVSYSYRNKYRMPDYHRLDMAFTYEGGLKKKQFWRSSWTLSVYNAYGRKNPFSVYYEKQLPSELNNYKTYALYKFSVIGVPVPSFTYNFWF